MSFSSHILASMLLLSVAISPTTAGNDWVGKWHFRDPAACKTEPGSEDNGLISYTHDRFVGYEITCKITQIIPSGTGVELYEQCMSEGSAYTVKETLEVIGNRIRRSANSDGQVSTSEFHRCR
jgi:hypothetical protein